MYKLVLTTCKIGNIMSLNLTGYLELNVSRWLTAYSTRNSQLSILPRCATLADVAGDGDNKVVVADLNENRLITFSEVSTSDMILHDVANSIIIFYMNHLAPSIPAVAVACGTDLFVYRNNKPYLKFRLASPISEKNVYAVSHPKITSGIPMALERQEKLEWKVLGNKSSITCMCTLKKSTYGQVTVSCPVVATESGNIYILDPQTLTILYQANTSSKKSTPFIICSIGLYDVQFKIVIGCREGHICILRKGCLEGKSFIELVHDIVDITVVPGDDFIVIGTNKKAISCFTKKGQSVWSNKTQDVITCICLFSIHHLNMNLIAVGLRDGTIMLYNGRYIVDNIIIPESPSTIVFGNLGQEENVMVVITTEGNMMYKILKRTAIFNVSVSDNVSVLQCKPILLPKRGKLFLEQNSRERDTAIVSVGSFQDVDNLVRHLYAVKGNKNLVEQKIVGSGCKLIVLLTIDNFNTEEWITELTILFQANPSIYNASTNIMKIFSVPPSYQHTIKIEMEELTNINLGGSFKLSPYLSICTKWTNIPYNFITLSVVSREHI